MGENADDKPKTGQDPGFSGPMPGIRPLKSRTRSTGRISPKARPACPSPSICRPRPATIPITCWPRAKSARSACRFLISATCARCSSGIPLAEMNTSMTINATAAWLLSLYIAVADETGAPRTKLTGTTQNDIIKEYLSRGTYVFPPGPSMRLIKDTILFTTKEMPKWNPMNVCSYHLQEAGATPVQELAYALATAIAILDMVKAIRRGAGRPDGRGGRPHLVLRQCRHALHHRNLQDARLRRHVGRDHRAALRHHRSEAAAVPLRRAGQFARPHRAAAGKQRLPHPARDAGGDAVEEGARPRGAACRPGTRRSACRGRSTSNGRCARSRSSPTRSDLLEYGDIFDGSIEIADKVDELKRAAKEELATIERLGGAVAAVEMGYMKQQLVESNTRRLEAIETRRQRRGRRQQVHRERALAADRRHRCDHDRVARGRSRADRAAQCLARRARRQGGRRRAQGTARAPRPTAATSCRPRSPAPRPASPPANGARCSARCSANIARRPASPKAARQVGGDGARAGSRRGRARVAQARPPPEIPGRQARPRRPFQRRRADRGARARRRHGCDLCRHPLHAGRNRQDRARTKARCDRAVDPLGQPCAAGARRGRAHARRRARATCRSWSAASFRRRTQRR